MALSVGLGRIVNDPDAPIRTRKALGRLATPGLLVTDEGLTINSDGRIVLKLSVGLQQGAFGLAVRAKSEGGISAGTFGLSEDDQGISVKLAPNSRLKLSNEGLALDDPLGDITVTNITVSQNATIAGNLAVAGILDTTIINSDTIINTGVISSDSLTVTGNASVGGTLTVATISIVTLAVSGNGSVAGTLTAGTLAVTGNAAIAGSMGCGSAAVGGALTAASATVSGAVNAATGVIGPNQFTALGLITGNIQANNVVSLGNLDSAGNSFIGGNLTVAGTITGGGGGGGGGAITPSSVTINGGTTILRCRSFFATFTFDPSSSVSDYFFSVPGAFAGDTVIFNPIGIYSNYMGSWCAAIYADGACMVRCVRPYSTSSGVTVFVNARITIIGFL